MPSQVVQLPSPTLAAILDHDVAGRSHAFGVRDLQAIAINAADGARALRVHLQPLVHCPDLRDHVVDDIYALLLTSGPPAAASPRALSAGLALHILHETEAALQELTELTGHDRLAVSYGFEHARAASPVVRAPRDRRAANCYESSLLGAAHRAQDVIAPAMARLDSKLASYQASLQVSGMQAAVLRLGLQSELGLRLRLNPVGSILVPRLFGATRRCGLHGLLRTTHNQLGSLQQMAEVIHDGSVADANWLTPSSLASLHGTLLANLPGMERAGRLRTGEMRIRSPFDGHVTVLELPGHEVEEAFAAFAGVFDAALWQGLHPVLRAAAAHLELARIHPFSDGNGRLARLLLQGLLLESGVPPLPLEAILAWNRVAYLAAVSRAVQQRDLLGFTQFVLKAIDQAILAGRHMIRVLRPHGEQVRESFLAIGAGGRLAWIASEFAGSMVLGPDSQLARRTSHAVEMSWLLNASPLFDAVQACALGFTLGGYDSDTAYSSPVARALTAAPLTLL
jgi:hypothetical protein